jgi:putative transposase
VIEGHRVILRETVQSFSSKGINAMTTAHDIDLPAVLAERLTTTHPDVLRELLATFIHTLIGAEADALCGAGYGQRSSDRTNQRNGYRQRQFDTRAGSLDLAIPKLRHGSYFLDWLLERRKRAERALTTVVATCYLLGVSTRRMGKLVETLGITSLSKSQVSVMAKELDVAVEAFRTRPLTSLTTTTEWAGYLCSGSTSLTTADRSRHQLSMADKSLRQRLKPSNALSSSRALPSDPTPVTRP